MGQWRPVGRDVVSHELAEERPAGRTACIVSDGIGRQRSADFVQLLIHALERLELGEQTPVAAALDIVDPSGRQAVIARGYGTFGHGGCEGAVAHDSSSNAS